MKTIKVSVVLLASAFSLAACSAAPGGDGQTSQARAAVTVADAGGATITFAANWTQVASAPLVAGQPVQIVFSPARLQSQCGWGSFAPGVSGGGGEWTVSGYYMLGSDIPNQFSSGNGNGVITPAIAGDLQIWFTCANTAGNTAVDSDYGQNYRFTVGQPASATTGTVVVQVVSDAVQGSAGNIPPDSISSAPLSGAGIYDGPFEAEKLLCTTDASGQCTATMSLGAHQLDVFEETSDESAIYSSANPVAVTTTPGTVVIHLVPNSVWIQTSYDAGYGDAIYVTGETSLLGNWQTAYKASFNPGLDSWTFQENIPIGAQFKLILAPWVPGTSIPINSAGLRWQTGSNQVVPPANEGPIINVEVYPSF